MHTDSEDNTILHLLERIAIAVERQNAPPPALIDAEEFARQIGVDVRTLRRMRHEGAVPEPIEIGNVLRWRRSDVERFLLGKKP